MDKNQAEETLRKLLDDEDYNYEIVDLDPLTIRLEGDWKFDHIRFKNFLDQVLDYDKYEWEFEEDPDEEYEEDYYSAYYIIKPKKVEEDMSNNGLFKQLYKDHRKWFGGEEDWAEDDSFAVVFTDGRHEVKDEGNRVSIRSYGEDDSKIDPVEEFLNNYKYIFTKKYEPRKHDSLVIYTVTGKKDLTKSGQSDKKVNLKENKYKDPERLRLLVDDAIADERDLAFDNSSWDLEMLDHLADNLMFNYDLYDEEELVNKTFKDRYDYYVKIRKDNKVEESNQLDKMAKFNKKRNKGRGWFMKQDAGNVPLNNAIFNSGVGAQGVSEELTEETEKRVTPSVLSPDSQAYKNLAEVAKMFEESSLNGYKYTLEDVYLDRGADWKWTTIICHSKYDRWQILDPAQWKRIANATSDEELKTEVSEAKKDKYWQDKPIEESSDNDGWGAFLEGDTHIIKFLDSEGEVVKRVVLRNSKDEDVEDAFKTYKNIYPEIVDYKFVRNPRLKESINIKESVYAVKDILSDLMTKDGRIRPPRNDEKLPRGFSFKSSTGTSGEVRYKGVDYAYAIVNGKLKVMTSAEAGSNWSETLYKESINIKEALNKLDSQTYCEYDLLNSYNSIKWTKESKNKLVEKLSENKSIGNKVRDINNLFESLMGIEETELKKALKEAYYPEEDEDSYIDSEWTDLDEERYTYIKSKEVTDSDGFNTEYTMYKDNVTGNFVFVFGDSDIYNPESGDLDYVAETRQEAEDWFNSYKGFEEIEESLNENKGFTREEVEKEVRKFSDEYNVADGFFVWKNYFVEFSINHIWVADKKAINTVLDDWKFKLEESLKEDTSADKNELLADIKSLFTQEALDTWCAVNIYEEDNYTSVFLWNEDVWDPSDDEIIESGYKDKDTYRDDMSAEVLIYPDLHIEVFEAGYGRNPKGRFTQKFESKEEMLEEVEELLKDYDKDIREKENQLFGI